MTDGGVALRLALDQNFPIPLVDAIAEFLPAELELKRLYVIDPRLSRLGDRSLFLTLSHLGWDGLVTNNHKMLNVPAELAAIIRTQAVVVAFEGLGDDPLRAAGALLLELPGLANRVVARQSNVFRIAHTRRAPQNGRDLFGRVADHQKRAEDELWEQVLVTDEEYEEARGFTGR